MCSDFPEQIEWQHLSHKQINKQNYRYENENEIETQNHIVITFILATQLDVYLFFMSLIYLKSMFFLNVPI